MELPLTIRGALGAPVRAVLFEEGQAGLGDAEVPEEIHLHVPVCVTNLCQSSSYRACYPDILHTHIPNQAQATYARKCSRLHHSVAPYFSKPALFIRAYSPSGLSDAILVTTASTCASFVTSRSTPVMLG